MLDVSSGSSAVCEGGALEVEGECGEAATARSPTASSFVHHRLSTSRLNNASCTACH
jgi:hypothetical protein